MQMLLIITCIKVILWPPMALIQSKNQVVVRVAAILFVDGVKGVKNVSYSDTHLNKW
jgi:hypothetical protein